MRPLTFIRQAAVAGSCLFVIAVALAKAPFARYIADDFSFATGYVEHGFFGFQRHFYDAVGGRFTATALEMVVSAAGRSWVPWFVMAGLVGLIAAIALASHTALRTVGSSQDRVSATLVALIATAALLETAPAFYQSLIWIAGFIIYGLPVALLCVVATLIMKGGAGPKDPGTPILGVTFLLALVSAGCSETAAVCQVAGFGTVALLTRGRTQKIAGTALAGSLVGFAIVAAAPGNTARRLALSKLLHPKPLPEAAWLTVKALLPEVRGLVVPIAPYLLMLCGVLLGRREATRVPIAGKRLAMIGARSLAVILAVVAAALLVGMWTMGGAPPHRAMFVTNAWVLAALMFLTLAWIELVPSSRAMEILLTVATIAAVALAPLRYPQQAIASVRHAREFARQSDAVDAFARAHPGADLFVGLPRIFEGLDVVSRSPEAWTSSSMARYYGVRSIASRNIAEPAALAGPGAPSP